MARADGPEPVSRPCPGSNLWASAWLHGRLMAAPSRPSAVRRSSSAMSVMVGRDAAPPAAVGTGRGRLARGARQRRLAQRDAGRPRCQPKKRLTRSRITADWCWISIAAGPSTRSTRVAGSGFVGDRSRAASGCLTGSAWAAISAPTISSQRVTSSVDAKPCRLNASARQRPTSAESGAERMACS